MADAKIDMALGKNDEILIVIECRNFFFEISLDDIIKSNRGAGRGNRRGRGGNVAGRGIQRQQRGGNVQRLNRGRFGKNNNGNNRGRGIAGGRNSFNQRNNNRSNKYVEDITE